MSGCGRPSPRRIFAAWLPVALYTSLIWFLSSQVLSIQLIEDIPLRDKGVHFLEYGALGFLMAHAVQVTWPDRVLRYVAALWLTVGLGLVDELHQVYVPGRSGDANDLIADFVGALVATFGYAGLRRLFGRGTPTPGQRHEEAAPEELLGAEQSPEA